MIHHSRLRHLNERAGNEKGQFVLYWMQASQRTRCNHALEYAIRQANQRRLPLIVCFGLMDDYPEANERHYFFMLQGLRDVRKNLEARGIRFIVRHGNPAEVALHYSKDAALLVTDRGYLRHQKAWRDRVADDALCEVVEVETDVVCPVEEVSDKHEFAARTIRPKIYRIWENYLVPLKPTRVNHPSLSLAVTGDLDVSDPGTLLGRLKVDRSVGKVDSFVGGEDRAGKLLAEFLKERLADYGQARNEPADHHVSWMSPYLHFGQISPLAIALAVKEVEAPQADIDSYLEELIVRRELSMNFCSFNAKYDDYACLPNWARQTLEKHAADQRDPIYTPTQLEEAKTADPYWNAAQTQMLRTGFMHNYMRMYWGKKILEWTNSPERAFEITLRLNNRYFLDGRDPNSFANVAWIFGLHDRPWTERKIFGTVRYMNAAGLERKFDIRRYVMKVMGEEEMLF